MDPPHNKKPITGAPLDWAVLELYSVYTASGRPGPLEPPDLLELTQRADAEGRAFEGIAVGHIVADVGVDAVCARMNACLSAIERAPCDSRSLFGRTFDGLRVDEFLGDGGMGFVHRGWQYASGRHVAIKFVRPLSTPRDLADLESRFREEGKQLGKLNHRYIAQIYQGGTAAVAPSRVLPYIAMEYVGGPRLAATRPSGSRRQTDQLVRLFHRICEGVHYAHQRGIFHRDINPRNVLLDRPHDASGEPEPKIVDFGLAINAIDGAGRALGPSGTPGYRPPAILRGNPVALASVDIFALGMVLHFLLAGDLPGKFSRATLHEPHLGLDEAARHAREADDIEAALRSGIRLPPYIAGRSHRTDLEAIIAKCLRYEDNDVERYQNVEALIDDLRRLEDGFCVSPRSEDRLYRFRRFVSRNVAALIATSLIILGLTGAYEYRQLALRSDVAGSRSAALAALRATAAEADRLTDRSPLGALGTLLSAVPATPVEQLPEQVYTSFWRALESAGGWRLSSNDNGTQLFAFSSDERYFAETVSPTKAQIWQLPTGIGEPKPIRLIDVGSDVHCLQFLAGNNIAIGTDSGGVTLNIEDGSYLITRWPDSSQAVTAIQLVSSQQRMVTIEAGTLRSRDSVTGRRLMNYHVPGGETKKFVVAPGVGDVFFQTKDAIWRLPSIPSESPEKVVTLAGDEMVMRTAVSNDGSRVALSIVGGTTVRRGVQVCERNMDGTWHASEIVPTDSLVSGLTWRRDGGMLAAGTTDGVLFVDPTGKYTLRSGAHHGWVMTVANLVSDTFVTGGEDGRVCLWGPSWPNNTPPRIYTGHQEQANAMAVSLDEKTLVTGSTDGSISVWSVSDDGLTNQRRLRASGSPVATLSVSSSGRWVSGGAGDGSARVWDTALPDPGSCLALPIADRVKRGSETTAVDIRTGRIAVANAGGDLHVFSADGTGFVTLTGHTSGYIDTVVFDRQGRWLLTHDFEEGTRLWNLDRTTESFRLKIDTLSSSVSAVFSADGRRAFFATVNEAGWVDCDDPKSEQTALSLPFVISRQGGLADCVAQNIWGGAATTLFVRTLPSNRAHQLQRLLSHLGTELAVLTVSDDGLRVVVERRSGDIELWEISDSGFTRTHTSALNGGRAPEHQVSASSELINGSVAANIDGRLVLLSATPDGSWHRSALGPERWQSHQILYDPAAAVLVGFGSDGSGCVWNNRASSNWSAPMKLPGVVAYPLSGITNGAFVTIGERPSDGMVWLAQNIPPLALPLPNFGVGIDRAWVTEAGVVVIRYDNGIIRCFPTNVSTLRSMATAVQKIPDGPPKPGNIRPALPNREQPGGRHAY